MAECELLAECAFFKKFAKTHVAACQGMIAEYCRGIRQSECKRKQHREKYQEPPSENMMPGGSIIRLDAQVFSQDSDGINVEDEIKGGSHLELTDEEGIPLNQDRPSK
jgi:hypothetical protein